MEGIAEGAHKGHAYHSKRNDPPPAGKKMRRVMREVTQDLPAQVAGLLGGKTGAVFVRADEDRPQYLRAVLTGLRGTPYADGAFVFDIYLPPTYPDKPLMMTHVTTGAKLVSANNGPGGFSPNLHKSTGKVCLSLLGTWKGPGWDPKTSNVYQALSTLLWMVLGAEHPYYMEPNHGGWEGTAPSGPGAKHSAKVVEYTERVRVGTARHAILGQLRAPPKGFERVTRAHFAARRAEIEATLARWAEGMSAASPHKRALEKLARKIGAALDAAA